MFNIEWNITRSGHAIAFFMAMDYQALDFSNIILKDR